MKNKIISAKTIVYINAIILILITSYFFLIPGLIVVKNINDPALNEGEISAEAWRLHKYLTPRYEKYVRERIASKKAGKIHYLNVPATEWPLFGCVFYLWSTENLQEAWENGDRSYSEVAPKVYAQETIEACKDLLLDPVHHTWVKKHWGDDYMHDQNVFFRSLLIAGLTSYEKLTENGKYIHLLIDQCDTLSAELDASPHGVLYDYPNECYPIDVFAAVAWIKMADEVTGKDHSKFIKRELRAFHPPYLDKHGMIPWLVDPQTAKQYGDGSRGIINSHVLIFAHEIYPEEGKKWYDLYEKHFWQKSWYGEGWREFYRDRPNSEWTFDVDSGPIIGGFSPAANAFGVASARVNGRMDHAYTLVTQILTASWPLPDGRLLGARLLSDWEHAPYLGETGILWQLSITAPEGMKKVKGGNIAGSIYLIGFAFYFGISLLVFAALFLRILRFRKSPDREYQNIKLQFILWSSCLIAGGTLIFINPLCALIMLLIQNYFPRFPVKADDNETEKGLEPVPVKQ